MLRVSKYHIQVTLGVTATGKRQARLTQLLTRFIGPCATSEVSLTAYQLGQAVNGGRPAINHTEFVRVVLYWTPNPQSEKDLLAVENWLWNYMKSSVLNDEKKRTSVLKSLKGTGWYFHGELIK